MNPLSYSWLKWILVFFFAFTLVATAQEQLPPPMDWLYRIEKAVAINLVTAAQGKSYIVGTQTARSKAFSIHYTPYKDNITTSSQEMPFSSTAASTQIFLHCLNEQGLPIWQKTWLYSAKENLVVQAITVDQGNNIHLMGNFSGWVNFNPSLSQKNTEKTTKGEHLIYLLQLNPEGELINVTTYPTTTLNPIGNVISLQLDHQQNYLYLLQDNGSYSKLTTNGDVVWSKKVLGKNHYKGFKLEPSDIAVDTENNLYILRYSDYHAELGKADEKVFPVPSSILKITPDGEKIWESALHTNSKTSFVVDEKGQVYWWSSLLNTRWTGTEQHFKVYLQSTLLLGKLNINGEQVWQKRFLVDNWTTASDIAIVDKEELYATYTQKYYLKQFGEAVATPSNSQEAISKTIKVFDLEGQERWKYELKFEKTAQDQLQLHYDKTSKKLLFWGALAPTSDLDVHPQKKFPAGTSSSKQVFQWSPVLPRP